MGINVELHTHTCHSHDSTLGKWFYLLMLKLRRINVVAITDHDEIEGALKFKPFLEKHSIRVIIGEEIFSSKGEIIGLFINEKISPGKSPRDTMLEIKKQGGIVYIPHPYDEKRYKTVLVEEEIQKNLDLIDIIEVHNGRNIKRYFSEIQLEIANRYNTTKAIGSDAHTFIELGRNYNIMEEFNDDPQKFKENLKRAKYVQKECLQVAHHITKFARVFKLIKRGKYSELCRIINKKLGNRKQKISN